jgi:hypothetical protein
MKLDEVQAELRVIAYGLKQPLLLELPLAEIGKRLDHLADQISRRKAVRKAPPRSRSLTPEMKRQIAEEVRANPDKTYHQIAMRWGVNAGRVSEAVAGFRE